MTSTLSNTRTGHPTVPSTVRAAFLFWLGALAAGGVEMFLHDVGLTGLAVRLSIYAVVIATALRMRAGRNWARLTLAVGLGVVGTLSLVIEPVTWLLEGHAISDVVQRSDLTGAFVALSRGAHLLCVWIAIPLMFSAGANAYFKHRNVGPK